MIVPRLAVQSLRNRALTASLTVLAIAFSVMLLLGVEKVRTGARQSFADTISGTDLIVGARTGNIQLLLYSVFRIGNATNNVTWKSYEDIANIMNCPIGTVRSRIFRAREAIAERLRPLLGTRKDRRW